MRNLGAWGWSTAFLLRDAVADVGVCLHGPAVVADAVDAVAKRVATQPHLAEVAHCGQITLSGLAGLAGLDPVGAARADRGEIQLAGARSGGLLGDVDAAALGGQRVGAVEGESDDGEGQDDDQWHDHAQAARLAASPRRPELPAPHRSPRYGS